MTSLRQISSELRNMTAKMRSGAKRALYAESQNLRSEFQGRSPVDTGKFQSRWGISRNRFAQGDSFGGVSIFNDNNIAELMEFGAGINEAPWYYPSSTKRTGKLAVKNGRVWAGGMKPGHTRTFGGAIGAGLFNNNRRLLKLTNKIADGVIGGIK